MRLRAPFLRLETEASADWGTLLTQWNYLPTWLTAF